MCGGGGEVRKETESERKETLLKLLSRKGQPKYTCMLVLQCRVWQYTSWAISTQ